MILDGVTIPECIVESLGEADLRCWYQHELSAFDLDDASEFLRPLMIDLLAARASRLRTGATSHDCAGANARRQKGESAARGAGVRAMAEALRAAQPVRYRSNNACAVQIAKEHGLGNSTVRKFLAQPG